MRSISRAVYLLLWCLIGGCLTTPLWAQPLSVDRLLAEASALQSKLETRRAKWNLFAGIANVLIKRGDADQARRWLELALPLLDQLAPRYRMDLYAEIANKLMQVAQIEYAHELLQQALGNPEKQDAGELAQSHQMLGEALHVLGQSQLAQRYLRTAMYWTMRQPAAPEAKLGALKQILAAQARVPDREGVRQTVEQLLAILGPAAGPSPPEPLPGPDQAEVLAAMARALITVGELERAARLATRIQDIAPRYATLANLAEAQFRAGARTDALRTLETAYAKAMQSTLPAYALREIKTHTAVAYARLRQEKKALRLLKALADEGREADPFVGQFVQAMVEDGRGQLAEQALPYIQLAGTRVRALGQLALWCARRGNAAKVDRLLRDMAATKLGRLLETREHMAETYIVLNEFFVEQGKYAAAATALEKAERIIRELPVGRRDPWLLNLVKQQMASRLAGAAKETARSISAREHQIAAYAAIAGGYTRLGQGERVYAWVLRTEDVDMKLSLLLSVADGMLDAPSYYSSWSEDEDAP